MARINQQLLERLQEKLGLSLPATYSRIEKRARAEKLPRELAAISLASDCGINISRFATPQQLAEIRSAASRPQAGAAVDASPPDTPSYVHSSNRNPKRRQRPSRKKGNHVFVVHGRNERLRKGMFQFLRSAGVQPIEWNKAISYARSASPQVSDILEAAFQKAQAVVVMLTPDDEAKLKDEFVRPGEPTHERRLTGQARPNVLFEAGLAFGTHPQQTVLVEFGKLRPISDIVGRHAVRMDGSTAKRQELMVKLQNAGCRVDFVGSDWQTDGDLKP